MKTTEIIQAIELCVRNAFPCTTAKYTAIRDDKKTVFCLHENMYALLENQLAPFLGECFIARKIYKSEVFIVFSCIDDAKAQPMLNLLSKAGRTERRKGRLRNAVGHHLESHYRNLWQIQEGRCYFSGETLGSSFETAKYHVDHIIPLAYRSMFGDPGGMNGTNWPINLALVTRRVNAGKGAYSAQEYLAIVGKGALFEIRPHPERKKIDRMRMDVFQDYMTEHCKNKEDYR